MARKPLSKTTKRSFMEKRKHPRATHVVTIHHRLYSRNGRTVKSSWQISLTENISAGGVLFASNVLYQLSDILELKVIMAGVLPIFEGLGKVVRIEHKRVVNIYKTAIYFAPVKTKAAGKRSTTAKKAVKKKPARKKVKKQTGKRKTDRAKTVKKKVKKD